MPFQRPKRSDCEKCRGGCCGPVPWKDHELDKLLATGIKIPTKAIVLRLKEREMTILGLPNGDCPFLKEGQCSVYLLRPKICKDYGMIKKMPCAYLYPQTLQKISPYLET